MLVDRNVLVPLRDGVTLAADLYRPARGGRAPVLLSFYPYRKDDIIGSFCEPHRRALVARGYAHLLVDVRGYGGSDGSSVESQDPRAEGRDAAEVVEWAAAQPWCDGAVGVWGVSYGGLVALAAGAERPAALGAIASIYGLQDVAGNFVAPGGVHSALGMYQREAVMLAQELSPPSLEDDDGRWREVWARRLERLRADGPSGPRWLAHPDGDDAYWRSRTIDLERIEVPAFIVGGWRDLFPSATVEAFARLSSATRLLVGPWLHVPPDLGPEPYDWIAELGDFFDLHLRGGTRHTRRATVFVEGSGGGWAETEAFPPAGGDLAQLYPSPSGVLGDAAEEGVATVALLATVGAAAGLHDPLGTGLGFPLEQGPDEARSATWTAPPAAEAATLAGSPVLALRAEPDSSAPVHLTAKLADVSRDGTSSLVCTGRLRIERAGDYEIPLDAIAYRLAAGHRWRLSLAGSDFPRSWPSPAPGSVRVELGASCLSLPIAAEGALAPATPRRPPAPPAESVSWSSPGDQPVWQIERDEASGSIEVRSGGGEQIDAPAGARVRISSRAQAAASDADPGAARVDAEAGIRLELVRGGLVEVAATVQATAGHERYHGVVRHDGELVLDVVWERP